MQSSSRVSLHPLIRWAVIPEPRFLGFTRTPERRETHTPDSHTHGDRPILDLRSLTRRSNSRAFQTEKRHVRAGRKTQTISNTTNINEMHQIPTDIRFAVFVSCVFSSICFVVDANVLGFLTAAMCAFDLLYVSNPARTFWIVTASLVMMSAQPNTDHLVKTFLIVTAWLWTTLWNFGWW